MRFTLNVREFPLKLFFSLLRHSVKMGGNCSTKEILKGLVDLLTAYKVTSPLPVPYLAIQAHPPMYLIELLTASRAASWRLKLTRKLITSKLRIFYITFHKNLFGISRTYIPKFMARWMSYLWIHLMTFVFFSSYST